LQRGAGLGICIFFAEDWKNEPSEPRGSRRGLLK